MSPGGMGLVISDFAALLGALTGGRRSWCRAGARVCATSWDIPGCRGGCQECCAMCSPCRASGVNTSYTEYLGIPACTCRCCTRSSGAAAWSWDLAPGVSTEPWNLFLAASNP